MYSNAFKTILNNSPSSQKSESKAHSVCSVYGLTTFNCMYILLFTMRYNVSNSFFHFFHTEYRILNNNTRVQRIAFLHSHSNISLAIEMILWLSGTDSVCIRCTYQHCPYKTIIIQCIDIDILSIFHRLIDPIDYHIRKKNIIFNTMLQCVLWSALHSPPSTILCPTGAKIYQYFCW